MNVINKIRHWLIEPHPKIIQDDQRRQATLLSTLLLFILLISTLYLISLLFWSAQTQTLQFTGTVITTVILFITYLASRTQWYETAVFLFAIGFGWTIVHSLHSSPTSFTLLISFLLPAMLSSMVISTRKTAVVAFIEFIFILYLIATHEALSRFGQEGSLLIILYLTFVGLILLAMRHRNQIEKTRQDRLLQQETRLQTYFDNATDWLFTLDIQGHITSVNQTVCKELGYSANEIIGQPPTIFLSDEDKPAIYAMIQTMFQGKEIPFAEIVVQDKNGRSIWLEVKGRKLFENNEIIGTFHIARNITDRKISENTREKLNREIKLLYETGRRLGQKIDLKTAYKTIYDSIIAVVDFKTFVVSSYDTQSQILTVEFVRQLGQELDTSQFPPATIGDEKIGIQKKVILTGESLLINNYFTDDTNKQYLQYQSKKHENTSSQFAYSIIIVPLKIDDQVQGIIQIHNDKINAFSQDNLHFLEALSSHIIAAITNANLLQQSQNELIERRRAEIEARNRQAVAESLQTSIALLNSSLSLEDVLNQILIQLHNALPYDSASIQQINKDQLNLIAARGFHDNAKLVGSSFSLETNLPNIHVIRTQAPLALDNVTESYPEFKVLAPEYQGEHIYSWLGVPLIAEANSVGMITIDRNEVRPFSQEEITLSTTFANHAAIALHNAALYRELETHRDLLEKAVATRTAEIQRTTDQVRAILRNSPEAILFLNADQTVELWNAAARILFEYEKGDRSNFPFLQLIADSDHDKFNNALETAVSTQTTQQIYLTVQSKNGRLTEVSAALAPVQEGDNLTGIVINLHDVSHLKEVERLKDAFVSNVSHELRTPITNLRLHHDLLSLNPKKKDVYMARLGREIDRLNIIIEDLLRISRLDQKRIKPILVELDLPILAEQYLSDRISSAQNKQITLSLVIEPTIPSVQGDPQLLEQVISILLTNAMIYTPPGGNIQFHPRFKHENGQTWAGLCISDTGLGIPENEQSQIFTRFFRGQSSIDTGEPGTGLGLAIAQEIMHLHQGFIELEHSSPQNGSTFIIWLPASNQSEFSTP